MASTKISLLADMNSLHAADDLLVIVDTSATDNKKTTLTDLFGNIPVSVSTSGRLTVSGNTAFGDLITISNPTAVTSNNSTDQFGAGKVGTIVWDNDYIYIAVDETTIRRLALTDWNS